MPWTSFLARRRVALGFVVAVAAAVLARPTWALWWMGLPVALAGEALRVWAAGHLEKGREVTQSGPYRWMRHPLYVGSSVLAAGVVVASGSLVIAALAAVYLLVTLTAAARAEEARLTAEFGTVYDEYRRSASTPMARRFSLARAVRNREYRAVLGVALGFAFLALRIVLSI